MLSKKIIFITGNLTQPRVIKRIKAFKEQGFDICVYGFDRGTFQNVNVLSSDIPVECLGHLENSQQYFKSLLLNRKKILPIFRKYRNQDVWYYTFGFIPALITLLYSSKPFTYEISDLIYGYLKNGLLREGFRIIDKFIIRRSYLTVLTSQGFYNYLFPKLNRKNVLVQPNKLESSFMDYRRVCSPISTDRIRFAFIGFLRYPNTVFRFASIIGERYPQHSFSFYGDSNYRDDVSMLAKKYNNVFFYGKFRNPEDLPDIYEKVDIVVACYDTSTFNEKVAEPNKLYEALFFGKPIIVSEGTFLSHRVSEMFCGYEIDASNDKNIVAFLNNLQVEDVNEKIRNIEKMDKSVMVDNPFDIFSALYNR